MRNCDFTVKKVTNKSHCGHLSVLTVHSNLGWRQTCPCAEVGWERNHVCPRNQGRKNDHGKNKTKATTTKNTYFHWYKKMDTFTHYKCTLNFIYLSCIFIPTRKARHLF